ncbi:hypothetical protein TNCV_3527251 [Trichonephila clavipes]|nr:hypothetical protein TNCV_3527251 [Trichonephila clavipes]
MAPPQNGVHIWEFPMSATAKLLKCSPVGKKIDGKEGKLPEPETGWISTRLMTIPPISTTIIKVWTGGEGNILQNLTRTSHSTTHKTYSLCTQRAFGGIGPKPSGMESDALTTKLPTAH